MPHQFPSTYPTNHALLAPHEHPHRVLSYRSNPVSALLSQEEPLCQRSLPPLFSVLEALEKCPTLRAVLDTFPLDIHYAVKASLLASDRYQDRRLHVLEKLISKRSMMSAIVEAAERVPLPWLLQHECVYAVIEGMLTDSKKYRRELAFLFTQLPVSRLPQHLHQTAISSVSLPLTVLPTYSGWYLCPMAEERLAQAMRDQAVLLVNGAILLKFKGKLSGVALQTTLLADGTQLFEGCWYAPIDRRDAICDAFDRGESRFCVDGEWAFIRAIDEDDDETLLQKTQACAAVLPERLPQEIAGRTRQTYRRDKHEGF